MAEYPECRICRQAELGNSRRFDLSSRPDPDELLRQVQIAEAKAERGRLKIFLGASAGVGKTYAMLSEAQEQERRGMDVVAGFVQTHGRKETDALADGLERIPLKELEYRGVKLTEFDIDAALARKPGLLLVDELAHTNAPGSRHPKRYQDVEELLKSGIDVYTTVNIQHLESLNDVVEQITGVQVQETISDSILHEADEVELVDIPPKDLIQRLKEGKVYMPGQAENAMKSFFREGNLIALRELALRRTADRVEAQMQSYRSEQAIEQLWATRERILVCIAPNRMGTRLVRAAKRMADSMHGDVIALYVESDRQVDRPAAQQARAQRALTLAESLHIETVTLSGHDIVGTVIEFAKKRNVTQIVVGKPIKPRWMELLRGSVVDELVRRSGNINVHVITGEEIPTKPLGQLQTVGVGSWQSYAWTGVIVGAATGLCFLLDSTRFTLANLIMVYLLGVAVVSSRFGPREAALASLVSVAAFDFFFVPPRYTFSVTDTQYFVTFAIMLGVALLISSLTQRMRAQAEAAGNREKRTAALYTLSKQLAKSRTKIEIAQATQEKVLDVFENEVAVLLPDDEDRLVPLALSKSRFESEKSEEGVADWSYKHGEPAGRGTDTLPGSAGIYIPLIATRGPVGVLAVRPVQDGHRLEQQQMDLLSSMANQVALAVERALLAKESNLARLQMESEQLRNSLLSSVSHDLRTPLTSISGAAGSLLSGGQSEEQRHELVTTIHEESERLNRLVRNLLDMTRVESGQLQLNVGWQSVEELIGSAVARTQKLLDGHRLEIDVAPDLPLLKLDGVLIEQVLVNLLENAAKHTPAGTAIAIRAQVARGFVRVEVEDDGPGIPRGEETRIFEKFLKAEGGKQVDGFGLGLAICKAILQAHGSNIWARNRMEGGASLIFELKVGETPVVPVE